MDGTGFAGRIAAIGKRCAAALARRTKEESEEQRGEYVAEAKEKAAVGHSGAKDVERTEEAEEVRNCTEKAFNGTEKEKKDAEKAYLKSDPESVP